MPFGRRAAMLLLITSAVSITLCGCKGHSENNTPPAQAAAAQPAQAAPAETASAAPAQGASQPGPSGGTTPDGTNPYIPQGLSNPPQDPLPVGTHAWDFQTKTLNGNSLTLTSLRGHVTVLDFWATWCGPCRMAIPGLQKLHQEYSGKGLRVVGISMDTDTASQVPSFVRHAGLTYTIALDPDRNAVACEHYNAGALPSIFILDQKGVVRWSCAGYYDGQDGDMKAVINKLLAQKV
ncbi:MAG TPA: TlpA disulfide reductase family protein [Capsulimonadaceae bacterium]|nr:TlpA disulfide reductase family protein [Capsulimonadaceae bacterium]